MARFTIARSARDDILSDVRYLVVDLAIYWFDVDEATRNVRIPAIFFQDHVRYILACLPRKAEPD
jgi:hypothetical protein